MEFSLGLIEVQALGHAIFVLDAMTKAANVEFVATERRLGGRLVTLVIKGNVSAVTAAIEAGKETAIQFNCLKASCVIARPHKEIFKFLHIDELGNPIEPKKETKEVPKKEEKVVSQKAEKVSKVAKTATVDKKAPKKATKKSVSSKKSSK